MPSDLERERSARDLLKLEARQNVLILQIRVDELEERLIALEVRNGSDGVFEVEIKKIDNDGKMHTNTVAADEVAVKQIASPDGQQGNE